MTQDASFNSLIEHLAQAHATARTNQELQGEIPTGEVEGRDPRGVVTARLDGSGVLASLQVADGWQEILAGDAEADVDAEMFQSALISAAAQAQARRFGFDSAPVDHPPRSIDEINRLLDEAAEAAVEVTAVDRAAVDAQVANVVKDIERAVATKTLEEAREDFKQQMDQLRALEIKVPEVTITEYSNESRTLTLKFSNGMLVGAEVKQVWVVKQSGKSLTMTLQSVLDEFAQNSS